MSVEAFASGGVSKSISTWMCKGFGTLKNYYQFGLKNLNNIVNKMKNTKSWKSKNMVH